MHNAKHLVVAAVVYVWKQATALELAKELRCALDVEVGAVPIALNSVRK
jgi:hypothetical protein